MLKEPSAIGLGTRAGGDRFRPPHRGTRGAKPAPAARLVASAEAFSKPAGSRVSRDGSYGRHAKAPVASADSPVAYESSLVAFAERSVAPDGPMIAADE